MLRDVSSLRFLRRGLQKNASQEEGENASQNMSESSLTVAAAAPGRAPLCPILEPGQKSENSTAHRKFDTPSKQHKGAKGLAKAESLDMTPEKQGLNFINRNRFGWVKRQDPPVSAVSIGRKSPLPKDTVRNEHKSIAFGPKALTYGGAADSYSVDGGSMPQTNNNKAHANSSSAHATPRSMRTTGKTQSYQSDACSSTSSTPTKSVSRPGSANTSNNNSYRVPSSQIIPSGRSKTSSIVSVAPSIVNTADVGHFDLREDPSFWMDHNVQVLVRIRPLNNAEIASQGYNRCLRQESNNSVSWMGPPETRFTFDHVACETITQEMLFKVAGLPMVENCMSGYNSCMFAYGQTGSGKTHTMLGDIEELDQRPSDNRGMTPRIFEYLFARIQAEEESRQQERMRYVCKCSFLEIYNEQITDLLEPSSNNLQLREDSRRGGVYVESLTEMEVKSVHDVLQLLILGAANRRVAATNMNRESSRSHSVFTCVIESHWEKDSMNNIRYGRLHLVDLAGSERQKTSGAEGERLKEAANINKSLSTLGLVIMILVDVAHGKQRHIPYRDSRLTFLLQDSLGGNSKTTIIANISPSICSANETLSTLKFAQRAKHIQNNAIINEDASGDVMTLQRQILQLKEELSFFKRQNVSRSLSFRSSIYPEIKQISGSEDRLSIIPMDSSEHCNSPLQFMHSKSFSDEEKSFNKKLKSVEAALAGSLRREQVAESTTRKLEAETEQLNRLVHQREEESQCNKMMMRFREEKIKRLEALTNGLLTSEEYLLEEKNALSEELQILRGRFDRNPEVTRFALENIKLLEQLRRYQDFFEGGEREILLSEISGLRDQLVEALDAKVQPENAAIALSISKMDSKNKELDECKAHLTASLEANEKLNRELENLQSRVRELEGLCNQQDVQLASSKEDKFHRQAEDAEASSMNVTYEFQEKTVREHELALKHCEEIMQLQMQLKSVEAVLEEENSCRKNAEDNAACLSLELEVASKKCLELKEDLEVALSKIDEEKTVINALESQQLFFIKEMDGLQEANQELLAQLHKKEEKKRKMVLKKSHSEGQCEDSSMHNKLEKMHEALEKARRLNTMLRDEQASHREETEQVQRQVEAETAEVIITLQEELLALREQVDATADRESETREKLELLQEQVTELQSRLDAITEENEELNLQLDQWEQASAEIAIYLNEGDQSLDDATEQMNTLIDLFPQRNHCSSSNKIDKVMAVFAEKEKAIHYLQRQLEIAKKSAFDTEEKIQSLQEATITVTELQKQEIDEMVKERAQMKSQIMEKDSTIEEMNKIVEFHQRDLEEVSKRSLVAFVVLDNRLDALVTRMQEKDDRIAQLETDLELSSWKEDSILDLSNENFTMNKMVDHLNGDLLSLSKERDGLIRALHSEQIKVEGLMKKLSSKEEELKEMEEDAESLWRETFEATIVLHLSLGALEIDEGKMEAAGKYEDKDNLPIQGILVLDCFAAEMQQRYKAATSELQEKDSHLRNTSTRLEKAEAALHDKEKSIVDMMKAFQVLEVTRNEMELQKRQLIADVEKTTLTCLEKEIEFQIVKQALVDILVKIEDVQTILDESSKELMVLQDERSTLLASVESQNCGWDNERLHFQLEIKRLEDQFISKKLVDAELAEMQYKFESKEKELYESQRTIEELLVEKHIKEEEKESLLKNEADATQRISKKDEELSSLQEILADLRNKLQAADDNLIILSTLVDEFKDSEEHHNLEKQELELQVAILYAELVSKVEEFNIFQLEALPKSSLQEELQKIEAETQLLRESLSEKAEMILSLRKELETSKSHVDYINNLEQQVISKETEARLMQQETAKMVKAMDEKMKESEDNWRKEKEMLYLEVDNYKLTAAEKAAEAAILHKQFRDSEAVIKEADLTLNALLEANKNAKSDTERWKNSEQELTIERCTLINEIHRAKVCFAEKEQVILAMKEQNEAILIEAKEMVSSIAEYASNTITTLEDEFSHLHYTIRQLKSDVLQSLNMPRLWVDEILSIVAENDIVSFVTHTCQNEAFMEQLQRSDGSNKVLQDSLLHSKKNTYHLEQRLIMLRSEIGTYLSQLKVSIESNLVNFEEEKHLLANRFQERISSIKAPDNPMLMPAAEMDSQLVALASEVEENLPVVLKFADRISNLSVEKEQLRKELEKSHEKNRQLQNEMDVLYEQFNESSNMVTILEGQHQSLRLSLCDEIQSLSKQLEECNFRYNETQEKKIQLENECKQYRSFISEIDVDQNAEEAFQSVKCGENFGRQLEALKGDISYLKMAKQTLSREIDDKDSQIASLREEIEEHADRQVSVREYLHFLERENRNLSLEFEEGFIKMQAFEMEKLMLWQKLDESYEISVEANMMSNRKDEEVTILQMQLGASNTCILMLQQENKEIQDRANYLEHSLQNQQSYIEKQNTELDKYQDTISKSLEELNLKCQQNQDLLVKLDTMQMENMELRRNILKEEEAKESLILDLQQCSSDLEEVKLENAALKEKDTGLMLLDSENQSLRERVEEVNSANKSLNETISKLGEHLSEIVEQLASKDDSLNSLCNSILQRTEDSSRYIEAVDSLDSRLSRVQEKISKGISLKDVEDSSLNMIENILEYLTILEEKVHSSLVHAKGVETNCKELSSQNSELRTELQRKDELLKGLEFDFSLLQESSTKAKDQKDEAQAVAAALRSVQEDLSAKCMGLEKELVMKETEVSRMTSEVDLLRKDVSLFSERNSELEDEVEELIAKKNFLDEELEEKQKSIDGLEEELLEMNSLVDHKTFASIESLKCELNSITRDRDRLHAEVLALNEQLEMVQAFADEREAIAVEARQVAETRKAYAEEKEEAVKILERCIEELEPTVTALETQLEMVRGEAERQRIRKEEVKAEAEALRHQLTTMQEYMTSPKARFTEYERPKGEKVDLQEALAQMRSLKMLAEEKDEEIKKCKNHIMELTVIAEEQAKEYQNKYKALEAMANQSKGEPNTDSLASATIMSSSLATNNKSSDKATARSRGSSSPFKCIGLGLTQQMNSEKEEELYALRRRCEELEDLVDTKQQEIFKLNTRLATAESMTHDLVRDLLGVKLDISHSMVNNQQFIKVVEKARRQNEESQGREIEVQKLKARLNELIEERESWLDEINRRQAEMVTARVAAEKLRQRDQFLSTENEMLKADTATQKRRMVALEEEVKKLSGQQNLQQRIHHHAKIKEENNLLRAQHEELLGSLRRTEGHLQRIKDELAKYRTAQGKKPFIDVDEEERLRKLLQETEEEKLQFAHKLVGLCSTIFQVAGVSRPSSEIEPTMAIETVQQLKDKLECTERELQDSKLKTKIANEKTRLSELKQFSSPARSANSFTTVQNTCPSPGNMRMR